MIHRTALVDPTAHVGGDVAIGPYAILGPHVSVGDRCQIAAHAVLERNVKLGTGVKVGYGSILGNDPQDLKYKGEDTWVEVGDGTVIREYCTINRGTAATGRTAVGQRCFLMSYVHLAHDCVIGDDVIIANAVQMAGHVTIEDRAIISEVKLALKRAYRLLFNSDMTVSQGIAKARAELPAVPEVERFLKFIEASQRGVLV